jgi:hypothetical protein
MLMLVEDEEPPSDGAPLRRRDAAVAVDTPIMLLVLLIQDRRTVLSNGYG